MLFRVGLDQDPGLLASVVGLDCKRDWLGCVRFYIVDTCRSLSVFAYSPMGLGDTTSNREAIDYDVVVTLQYNIILA